MRSCGEKMEMETVNGLGVSRVPSAFRDGKPKDAAKKIGLRLT